MYICDFMMCASASLPDELNKLRADDHSHTNKHKDEDAQRIFLKQTEQLVAQADERSNKQHLEWQDMLNRERQGFLKRLSEEQELWTKRLKQSDDLVSSLRSEILQLQQYSGQMQIQLQSPPSPEAVQFAVGAS